MTWPLGRRWYRTQNPLSPFPHRWKGNRTLVRKQGPRPTVDCFQFARARRRAQKGAVVCPDFGTSGRTLHQRASCTDHAALPRQSISVRSRVKPTTPSLNICAVSETGPVCVNLLIFSDFAPNHLWQGAGEKSPDFPQNYHAMLRIVSKIWQSVMSLCQDRGQTTAKADDSANLDNGSARCLPCHGGSAFWPWRKI